MKFSPKKGKNKGTKLPSLKIDKYAIRFYCIVDWKTTYLHRMFDNGCGNNSGKSGAERYVELFSNMRTPLARVLCFGTVEKSVKALWETITVQKTKRANARRESISIN